MRKNVFSLNRRAFYFSARAFDFEAKVALLQDVLVRFNDGAVGHVIAVTGLILLAPNPLEIVATSYLMMTGAILVAVSVFMRLHNRHKIMRALKLATERKSRRLFERARSSFFIALGMSAVGWCAFSYGLLEVLPHDHPSRMFLQMFIVTLAIIGSTVACYSRVALGGYLFAILSPPAIHFAVHENSPTISVLMFVSAFYFFRFGLTYRNNLAQMVARLAEERRNRSQFHETLDSMPLRVCVVENEKMSFVNKNFANFVGRRPRDLVDRPPQLLDPEISTLIEECVRNDWLDLRRQMLLKNVSHEMRWHMVAIRRLQSSSTSIVAALDIHDQRNAEIREIENRARVEASSRMATIGQVSAGIAHEINNPLAIIIAKAESLYANFDSIPQPQLKDGLRKIEQTGLRIAKIVRTLRALSRDGTQDPMTKVSVSEVVSETLTLFEEKIRSAAVQFKVNVATDQFVMCRSVELAQVITNLVGNAMDAIQSGGVKAPDNWVSIESNVSVDFVDIRIANGGPKIPDLVADRIGTPFFTTKPAGQGTGLGLTISKKLIQENGGEFALVRAAPNTTFSVRMKRHTGEGQKAS